MTPNALFYLIVLILLFDYLLDKFLELLNIRNLKTSLPNELMGIYEDEKYAKSQNYLRTTTRFGFITGTYSIIILIVFLLIDGFALTDNIARAGSSNIILTGLLFFGLLMFASDILNTPFSIYSVFVIEERFGFNKTTPKTFLIDKIKGWILSAILGGGILALIIWFYQLTEQYFWVFAWGAVSIFMIFMTMFYTSIIVPWFNKLEPLDDGDLRKSIFQYANKVGFNLDNIYVIDGSKRSTKANAYFSGLGKRKKIVLFDTLIESLTTEEIVAVLAHEVGHYKKKHTLSHVFLSIFQTGVTLYILSLIIGNPILSQALGVDEPSFHVGLVTFGILYSPISLITGLITNIFTRKNEFQADTFASQTYEGIHLINALKKLSVNNLSNLTPHWLYVFFNYSHPPLLQRIKSIKGEMDI